MDAKIFEKIQQKQKENSKNGRLAIVACVIVYLSVGSINSINLFYKEIFNFMTTKNGYEFDQEAKVTMQLIYYTGFVISMPLSIYSAVHIGFRTTFVISVFVHFGSDILLSLYHNSFFVKNVYPGILGLSNATFEILPLYCCWRYYLVYNKSNVAGIVLGAKALTYSGFKMLIFAIIGTQKTLKDEEEKLDKFGVFHILGCLGTLAVCTVCILFIRTPFTINRPEEQEYKKLFGSLLMHSFSNLKDPQQGTILSIYNFNTQITLTVIPHWII